jgi:type II secretory pathway component GspD/PulD (secretin)
MKTPCASFALLALLAFSIEAQTLKKMEFRDQSITDILLVLAEASGTSIVPDETVTGNASFFFSESSFEEALALFLATYRLHYRHEGNIYYVSRIAASFDKEKKLVSIVADEVDVQLLIRSLSKAAGTTILFDSLPRANITVNIEALPLEKALEIIMRRFPEYAVVIDADYRYIRRIPTEQLKDGAAGKKSAPAINRNGERYSIDLEKGRFLETIVELFKAAGKEYSLLTKNDSVLENLYFSDREFDGLLRLLLEQGNADFVVSNGVYYVVEMQRRDVVKKLKRSEIYPLSYLSVQDLPNLLPSELTAGSLFRVDKNSNTVILTGSDEEIRPIVEFIKLVDRPLEGRAYARFDVKYLKAKDLIAILPPKLLPTTPAIIPESNSFVILATDEGRSALQGYIELVDKKSVGAPIRLRYIKTEDLIKTLPPSVAKEDVVDSGSLNLVFFTGSEDKRRIFMRELELIDRPKPQIRYELLVVQYEEGSNTTWTRSVTQSDNAEGSGDTFLGQLSNVFALNFDVVSQFGYLFATKLSLEIGENKAKVYADTTLNGLSGQEVKFQNTNTYRYRESETDEDTGEVKLTGVTQSITSGLIVGLNGWVSGDGMVTMTVNLTVSKQSDTSSTSTTSIPPTSERVVTTQVRTASGKPIVIGGLMQKETSKSIKKFPILGDIPLLGLLFRDQSTSETNTEIVLYIVPHVSWGEEGSTVSDSVRLERYYLNFVKGYRD